MKKLVESYKNSGHLHHAYFLVGEIESLITELVSFLEESIGIKTSGNPDFWRGHFDVFTIDEARQLSEIQERKALTQSIKDATGQKKVFIIQANSITEQAQNALLKVFEEPTPHTHFFLLMPQDTLLPTLRSRLQIISAEDAHLQKQSADGRLLQKSLAERLDVVKELTEGIKDEENTKQDAINLLNQIESELLADGRLLQNREKLKVCQLTRAALNDNGAPVKMILENLMLSV